MNQENETLLISSLVRRLLKNGLAPSKVDRIVDQQAKIAARRANEGGLHTQVQFLLSAGMSPEQIELKLFLKD